MSSLIPMPKAFEAMLEAIEHMPVPYLFKLQNEIEARLKHLAAAPERHKERMRAFTS